MSGPPPIQPQERLGREVFSRSSAKRAERGKIQHNVFLATEVADSLSVDRIDQATPDVIKPIAEINAARQSKPFCGWAFVRAEQAEGDGRSVEATPQLGNQFHADIFLNVPEGAERRDSQKQHALQLAKVADWQSAASY